MAEVTKSRKVNVMATIATAGYGFDITLKIDEFRWAGKSCDEARNELLSLIDDTVDELLRIAETLEETDDYASDDEGRAKDEEAEDSH